MTPPPKESDSDNDLPPSYTEATSSIIPTNILLPTSPLTTHLRTLPARLRATQQARTTAQQARDIAVVTRLLAPGVEAFLADLAAAMPRGVRPPFVAELTLVPAAAVPHGWAMSGAAERRKEGEVVRVVRVDGDGELEKWMTMTTTQPQQRPGGEDSKGRRGLGGGGDERGEDDDDKDDDGVGGGSAAAEAAFDEWGRFETDEMGHGGGGGAAANTWWFKDEDMARRLAAYLRPEPAPGRKTVQPQAVVAEKAPVVKEEKSGWRWGLGVSSRRKSEKQSSSPTLPSSSPPATSHAAAGPDDSVKMTVRAEEVTFRKENDFGVWESRSGFGIVVTVRVSRT
ncbi:hypothetical protein VTK56DRAFT_1507 [Thermocarpiscus australiensis]